MKKYKVKIEQEALKDIQEITNWYNDQQKGLGKRFTVLHQIGEYSLYLPKY